MNFAKAATLSVGIFILTAVTNTAQATTQESNYAKAKKIVHAVFPNKYEGYAMKIAGCETGHTYSKWVTGAAGERGYFQIHPSNAGRSLYDPRTKKKVGRIQFEKLYNPWYNTWVAYYMSNGGKRWSEWTCSRYVVGKPATANRSIANHGSKKRISIVRKLQRGLSGFPLRSQAFGLEAAGHKYNVSPYFMAAASGVESTFGRQPCYENPRNIWGLGACNQAWTVPYFETWKEAFHYYARFLKRTWPNATTAYHYYGYSACDSCWGGKVSYYMRYFFNVGPSIRYNY